MHYEVFLTKKAQEDFVSIFDYLSIVGDLTAKIFRDSVVKQLDILADGIINYSLSAFPELSTLGYHTVFFGSYVLLYYEQENKRIVAHIFHQSQNYAKLV